MSYDIRLDEKYGHLQPIDLAAEAVAHEPCDGRLMIDIEDEGGSG
jgi:hypothetical protein